MYKTPQIPDYEQDYLFDEDIDMMAFTTISSAIGATIGAGLSAVATAIYFLIINNL
jgi:hypothetical protein